MSQVEGDLFGGGVGIGNWVRTIRGCVRVKVGMLRLRSEDREAILTAALGMTRATFCHAERSREDRQVVPAESKHPYPRPKCGRHFLSAVTSVTATPARILQSCPDARPTLLLRLHHGKPDRNSLHWSERQSS